MENTTNTTKNFPTPTKLKELKEVEEIKNIELSKIEFSPFQVRLEYDEEKLDELVQSIKNQGLIQPIVVKKLEDDKYQIIAGHRRFLAFKELERETIPAIIKNDLIISNEELITLSENIIRENLNPLEIAFAFDNILQSGAVENQAKLAKKIGVNRSTITLYLKLLKLPKEIKEAVRKKEYTDLIVLNKLTKLKEAEALKIFNKIIKEKLNRKEASDLIDNVINKKKNNNKDDNNSLTRGAGFRIEKTSKTLKIEIDITKIKDEFVIEAFNHLEKYVLEATRPKQQKTQERELFN